MDWLKALLKTWFKIPKLRYLIPALLLVGGAAWLQEKLANDPQWELRLRASMAQLQKDLALVDATLLGRTYWQAASDYFWVCTDHPPRLICSPSGTSDAGSLPSAGGPATPRDEQLRQLSPISPPLSQRQCEWLQASRVCKAGGPERLFAAPVVAAKVAALTLWEKLDWLALLLFGVSAVLALALLLALTGGRNPGLLVYLVPFLAAPVAFLLKWLLIGALAILGPLLGFVAWLAGLLTGLASAIKIIAYAIKAYRLAQKIESTMTPAAAAAGAASSSPQISKPPDARA